MSITVQRLSRKFKIGALELQDPIPNGSLEEVQELLTVQYPTLRHTKIFESGGVISTCGAFMVYEFIIQPVKTQG